MNKFSIFWLVLCGCTIGCDIPYKEEYDRAMELKAQAEQKAAEAQAAAEEAKNALTAEQNAINRLYNED
jgi:hypothetical protein